MDDKDIIDDLNHDYEKLIVDQTLTNILKNLLKLQMSYTNKDKILKFGCHY